MVHWFPYTNWLLFFIKCLYIFLELYSFNTNILDNYRNIVPGAPGAPREPCGPCGECPGGPGGPKIEIELLKKSTVSSKL